MNKFLTEEELYDLLRMIQLIEEEDEHDESDTQDEAANYSRNKHNIGLIDDIINNTLLQPTTIESTQVDNLLKLGELQRLLLLREV